MFTPVRIAFLSEIWAICDAVCDLEVELQSYIETTGLATKNLIDNSYVPHKIVSSVLVNAARLQKIFHADSRKNGEAEDDYEVRKERAKYFRKALLKSIKKPEFLNTSVRNAVEHYDSRLDALSNEILKGGDFAHSKSLAFHMTVSSTSVFEGDGWSRMIPAKVLVVDDYRYFLFDNKLRPISTDLKKLFSDVRKLKKNNKELLDPEDKLNSPPGLIKVAPHET